MSRPNDTLRGARLAFVVAHRKTVQPDLFPRSPGTPDREFWVGIRDRALAAIADEEWAIRIQREARYA